MRVAGLPAGQRGGRINGCLPLLQLEATGSPAGSAAAASGRQRLLLQQLQLCCVGTAALELWQRGQASCVQPLLQQGLNTRQTAACGQAGSCDGRRRSCACCASQGCLNGRRAMCPCIASSRHQGIKCLQSVSRRRRGQLLACALGCTRHCTQRAAANRQRAAGGLSGIVRLDLHGRVV